MNVPNLLSLLRLVLVPVFAIVFFADIPYAHQIAGGIFLLAALTDALDGRIARKLNQITMLGRILDPLADKLMTGAALVCIIIDGTIPLWIFIVYGAKELTMLAGSLVLYKRIVDVPPSNILGKAATVVFFASCLAMMFFDVPNPAATIVMSVALALTLVAFFGYCRMMLRILKNQKTK